MTSKLYIITGVVSIVVLLIIGVIILMTVGVSRGGNGEVKIEGLETVTLTAGSGVRVKTGDTIAVHYKGSFLDGTVFDENVGSDEPFVFTVGAGRVIAGWDIGTVGMQVGERRKLVIPFELAYGESGRPPIPPRATLVFEIDLVKIY